VLVPACVGQPLGRAQVHLVEFGDHQLIVNERFVRPKPGKSLERPSCVAAREGTVSYADAPP